MTRIVEWGTLVSAEIGAQFEHSSIAVRELSGVGFFSNFLVPPDVPRITPSQFEISVDAELTNGLPVGFTLFVRDGSISMLEGYVFGDAPWPERPVIKHWFETPDD